MNDPAERNDHALRLTDQEWCIWMAAGVISFKICPLGYDCDHCDFDRVIKQKQTLPHEKEHRAVDDSNNPT